MFDLSDHAILVTGRAIAFVSSLALSTLLGGWIWRRYGNVAAALLAAMAPWFYHAIAISDFFRFRPESPALAFILAGVPEDEVGWILGGNAAGFYGSGAVSRCISSAGGEAQPSGAHRSASSRRREQRGGRARTARGSHRFARSMPGADRTGPRDAGRSPALPGPERAVP